MGSITVHSVLRGAKAEVALVWIHKVYLTTTTSNNILGIAIQVSSQINLK